MDFVRVEEGMIADNEEASHFEEKFQLLVQAGSLYTSHTTSKTRQLLKNNLSLQQAITFVLRFRSKTFKRLERALQEARF